MASRTLKQLCLLTLATLTTASPPNGWWTNTEGQDWNSNNGDNTNFWGPGSSNPYNPSSPINNFNPSDFAESTIGMAPSTASSMIQIHGILASIAFVALFPIGSIAIRVIPSKHAWLVHAVTQVIAYTLYIAAAAIGLWLVSTLHFPASFFGSGSGSGDDITLFSITAINYHFIIGIVILVVIFFQPLTGFVHHIKHKHAAQDAAYRNNNGNNNKDYYSTSSPQRATTPPPQQAPYIKRTAWSHIHLWLGRLTITMGMINGGLGLGIADVSDNLIIAYSVIAGVMWLIWVAAMVYGEVKRSKAREVDRKRPRDMRVMPGAYTGGEGYSTYRAPGGGGGGGGRGNGRGAYYYSSPVYENPDAVGIHNNNDDNNAEIGQQQPSEEGRRGSRWSTTASVVSSDARRAEPPPPQQQQQQAGDQVPFYRTPPAPPADYESTSTGPEPAGSPTLPLQAPQPTREGDRTEQQQQQPVARNDTVSPLSIYAVRY